MIKVYKEGQPYLIIPEKPVDNDTYVICLKHISKRLTCYYAVVHTPHHQKMTIVRYNPCNGNIFSIEINDCLRQKINAKIHEYLMDGNIRKNNHIYLCNSSLFATLDRYDELGKQILNHTGYDCCKIK